VMLMLIIMVGFRAQSGGQTGMTGASSSEAASTSPAVRGNSYKVRNHVQPPSGLRSAEHPEVSRPRSSHQDLKCNGGKRRDARSRNRQACCRSSNQLAASV
jgi:hypothetical protein